MQLGYTFIPDDQLALTQPLGANPCKGQGKGLWAGTHASWVGW